MEETDPGGFDLEILVCFCLWLDAIECSACGVTDVNGYTLN